MSIEPSSGASGVSQLFQLLRDGVPRTRAELAKSTGLARSTIAARVDELMRMGLITPIADGVSTGGRPPSQFALNPGARLVLAADIGASHAKLAITDLTGTILVEHGEPLDVTLGPVTVLTWVVENAQMLMERLMPGWDRFDVPGWVRQHLDVPVLVDNDVNIMALGERAAAYPNVEHLMFVKIATHWARMGNFEITRNGEVFEEVSIA